MTPQTMPDSRSKSDKCGSSGRSTPRSLIERLKQGEATAWRELVRIYAPLIFHWCQKQKLPNQECADIVQDVFRSVVANIAKFRKAQSGDTFRGWLRTITRNKINDYFRRTTGEPRAVGGTEAQLRWNQLADSDEQPLDDDDAAAEQGLYLRALELIRADFKEQTWQAFWRVVVEGRSAQDVAAELGMRPGTVRVAKSRVLKRLRKQLGDIE
jgi:RNA polymerase sigma-70 factor (ECF subfamily)